jgi:Domain of unknown function (DUF929)
MPKKSSTDRRKPGASGQQGGQRSARPAQQSSQARPRTGVTAQSAAQPARPASSQTQTSRTAQTSARNGSSANGTTTRSPLESIRERRPPVQVNRSRRRMRRSWWQGYTPVIATVVVVAALIGVFIRLSLGGSGGSTGSAQGTPVPSQVLKDVTQVSPNVFTAVGTGGNPNPLHSIPSAALQGSDGKPEFLYMGAGYCPFCAAERWSMVVALSRFGTFQNLHLTSSSSSDVYPNTNTFTFYGSTYSSQYIDFVSVEETTQDQNTPLQTPTAQQQQIISTYDAAPYVPSNLANGIPFIDIAGRYIQVSSGYSPQDIANLSWSDIASKLSGSNDKVTQDIIGNANWLTAAICKATGDKPANVCTTSTIQQIEHQLP